MHRKVLPYVFPVQLVASAGEHLHNIAASYIKHNRSSVALSPGSDNGKAETFRIKLYRCVKILYLYADMMKSGSFYFSVFHFIIPLFFKTP